MLSWRLEVASAHPARTPVKGTAARALHYGRGGSRVALYNEELALSICERIAKGETSSNLQRRPHA